MRANVYEIENLPRAREYLTQAKERVILSNPEGSTRYYGMRVLDYIFKILQEEFPEKVEGIIVDVYDDYAALTTAKQLGYGIIKYAGPM